MTLSARNVGVLVKIETTPNVDAVPTPANDAVLPSSPPDLTPLVAEFQDRNLLRPYFGNSESILTKTSSSVSLQVEMQGSGTLAVPPAMRDLLLSAGFVETVNAGVSVVYTPRTGGEPTATIYCYKDQILHKILGAMANLQIAVNAKSVPQFTFPFVGKYVPPIDGTLIAPDYTSWKIPVAANSDNTTCSLGGIPVCVESFSYDHGNQVVFSDRIGCASSGVTDRKPSGAISIEAVTVAVRDWWDLIVAGTSVPFVLTHGLTAGSKVRIEIPAFQITTPTYGESDNTLLHNFDYKANPVVGNDEIKITFF